MGTPMKNAPIYFALGQARFNVVMPMEQYLGAIQDQLRRSGYPDFGRAVTDNINLNLGANISDGPSFSLPQLMYMFLDEHKHSGFVLQQNALSFITTHYETFEPFKDAFARGLDIVHKVAELSYSERVGYRVLDAVCPRDGETPSDYLRPSVLGLYDQFGQSQLVHMVSETRMQDRNTTRVSRVSIFKQSLGAAAFPPDLQPVSLILKDRFASINGIYAIIDNDCWRDERERFSSSTIANHLQELHDFVAESFYATVSKHALAVWG